MIQSQRQSRISRPFGPVASLAVSCILAWILAPSGMNAQRSPARTPLTVPTIVKAMQDRQLPTSGVEVRLAIPMTSARPDPALEIQEVTVINQHGLRLRMACLDRLECIPFFAFVTYPEPLDPATFQLKASRHVSIGAKPEPETRAVAEAPVRSTPSKLLDSTKPPLLRSGSPATLDFDADRVHVRVEVICLESGTTGDSIHVTTRDHKQIYLAEIVAPKALKGTLKR